MELALIVTTAVSVVLAAAMGIVAWRLARAERMRSAARVATLTHDLRRVENVREQAALGGRAEAGRVHHVARWPVDLDQVERRAGRGPLAAGEMFRAGASDRSGSRLATVLAVGSFAVATSLALVVATSRVGPSIAEPATAPALTTAPRVDAAPLELVALSHERDGDRITIRGVVRNPRDGARVERLMAAVYLYDREGGFLKSGEAAVDTRVLSPATGSAFVVTLDQAGNVGRYRVSFKIGDRVVSHVDHRNAGSTARSDP